MLLKNERMYFASEITVINDPAIPKSYSPEQVYLYDMSRWYDALPQEYQEYAQAEKMQSLLATFMEVDDMERCEMFELYPEFKAWLRNLVGG